MEPIYPKSNFPITLCSKELQQINGGTIQEGYDAGHAAGAYVRKILEGVGLLALFF